MLRNALARVSAWLQPAAMVTGILALLAATAGAEAPASERTLSAHLGVTATVVRPAEIDSVSTADGGAITTVRNSASLEVLADGGAVGQIDDDTAVVRSEAGDSLFVTLVY